MLANPFNPGVFHPDMSLFGRESQIQVVDQVVGQIENGYPHSPVCFLGAPGLGKTTILKHLAIDLKRRHWLCGYSEAGSDVGSAIYDILADAQQLAPAQGAARRLLSRVQRFNASAGPVSIGLDLQSIENGSAYVRLLELFRTLGNTANSDLVGAALFLDEAQVLPEGHLEILFRALDAVEASPVVLFMGALPNLMDKIVPSYRTMPHVLLSDLEPLEGASAEQALVEPARLAGGEFDIDALAVLLEFAQGHPLALQLLGRSAWNLGASDIPEDQVVIISKTHAIQAIRQVHEQLTLNYFRPTWRNCTTSERVLLRALARAGNPITESDLMQVVQGGVADADIVLYDLSGKGIVSVGNERVSFVMPGFREFVAGAQ
jgi:AAA ATPase-like protein